MSYIRLIEPDDAAPALQQASAHVGAARGRVANVLKARSVNPAATTAHLELYKALMCGPSELTRVERVPWSRSR